MTAVELKEGTQQLKKSYRSDILVVLLRRQRQDILQILSGNAGGGNHGSCCEALQDFGLSKVAVGPPSRFGAPKN